MTTDRRPSFYHKDTDDEIIRWFAAYQYLEPRHVAILSGRNIISVRRRLGQLREQGLLICIVRPFEHHVYFLSGKGINLAREVGIGDEHTRANSEKSEMTLAHDLFLTTFHLTLHLATEATAGLQLLSWEQRRSVLQDYVYTSRDRFSVNPDAFFALANEGKPEDRSMNCFFLEYERSRPHSHGKYGGDSNFIRKARGFLAYHEHGRHTQRYRIQNFRVVTITPTRERAENLCRSMAEAKEGDLKRKRFWFTDETHISLERPAEILEKIFFTPDDFARGILYSLRT